MSGKRENIFWPIILAIFFGNFVAVLSSSTVVIILPSLMDIFQIDISMVQWAVTSFMLAMGVVAPIVGYVCDLYGPKKVYIAALTGFTFASFLCSFSWDIYSLILFRVIQGAFAGVIFPTTMTIVYQFIEPRQRAFALSLWSTSGVLAPVLGPTIAGMIVEYLDWHWVFLMNVPVAAIAIAVAMIFIPNVERTPQKTGKFDFVGLIGGVLGTLVLLYTFSSSERWGLFSGKTMMMTASGIIIIALFIKWELKQQKPLLNFNVFRSPEFALGNIVSVLLTIGLNCSIFLLPIYLQTIRGFSPIEAGLVMFVGPLSVFIVSPIVGKIYHRFKPICFITVGMSVLALGLWLLHYMDVDTQRMAIMGAIIIMETGLAIVSVPATNYAMESLPQEVSSHGAGINSWIKQGAGALAIGLLSALVLIRTNAHELKFQESHSGLPSEEIYTMAYTQGISDIYVGACCLLIVCMLLINVRYRVIEKKKSVETQDIKQRVSA